MFSLFTSVAVTTDDTTPVATVHNYRPKEITWMQPQSCLWTIISTKILQYNCRLCSRNSSCYCYCYNTHRLAADVVLTLAQLRLTQAGWN